MKADSLHLFDFLGKGKTIFEIPVFQRNYEWDDQQCDQLFNDMVASAKDDQDHFIGAIVYVDEEGPKQGHIYKIIDGQQRLTSLTLLLKALSEADEKNKDEIEHEYLKNSYLNINHNLKLKPVEHDISAFYAVMDGDASEYIDPSKIKQNYLRFKTLIKNCNISKTKLFEALNHFTLVYIELENDSQDENPQVIFESLNSTGVSLSPSDLVRNFLLMKLDSEQQEDLYKRYWMKIENLFTTKALAEFIRHYLTMKMHARINKEKVYQSYKDFYLQNHLTSEEALRDLYTFSKYYCRLLHANTGIDEVDRTLAFINAMDSKVVYPYFLMLIELVETEKLSYSDFVKAIKIMESYLYRLKACRGKTNSLSTMIAKLCDRNSDSNGYLEQEINVLDSSFYTDKELIDSLSNINLQKQRNNLAKLTLIALEENTTKNIIDLDAVKVERIMPQRLTNDWKIDVPNAIKISEEIGGTIGNLVLVNNGQEGGNRSFREKRRAYLASNFELTKSVAVNRYKWNKNSILDRTKSMSEQLTKIFPKPIISSKKKEMLAGEHMIYEPLDITGKKPVQITICGDTYSVDSWRKMLVSFMEYAWKADSRNYEKIKEDKELRAALLTFNSQRVPEKLSNGIWIETNFPANTILAIIAKIADICDISDEVSYAVK